LKKFGFFGRPAAAVTLAAGMIIGGFGAATIGRTAAVNPPATFKFANPAEGPSRTGFGPIVKKAQPEVVNISTSKVVKTPTGFSGGQMDPFFRQFFGGEMPRGNQAPRARKEHSLGSGVIVSPEGYILTNNHVVDGATDVRVTMGDKREFQARVVGTDPQIDIAVLKIDGDRLPAITIGDSSQVQVGDYALAIGNPFGVGQTVTMGIVSATGRGGLGIEDYEDFIQTDAPINPGNSGGALINDRGELIGINTAILTHSDGNQGIGFAVPVNLARQVMDQILKNGKVTRAYLGIIPQEVTPAIAKAFHATEMRGALVGDVSANSPAERAGIQKGDIIMDVNGKPVSDPNQLRMSISMMEPGSTVKVNVLRDGKPAQFTVKLDELPVKQERASADKPGAQGSLDGVEVENLTPQDARELNLPARTGGVVVTSVDPGSQAAEAGLRKGDVIQEVNRKPVHNANEFEQAVRNAGKSPLLLVNRQGNTLFLAV
jgi:serine protease Do